MQDQQTGKFDTNIMQPITQIQSPKIEYDCFPFKVTIDRANNLIVLEEKASSTRVEITNGLVQDGGGLVIRNIRKIVPVKWPLSDQPAIKVL